jgi:hypothetical protein
MQTREIGIYALRELGGQWMDASGWLALLGASSAGKLRLIQE